MNDAILVALITGGISLVGTVTTVLASSAKQSSTIFGKLDKEIAVLNERICQLKSSVDRHNNFAARMPVLEERMEDIARRVAVLEKEGRNHAAG